MATIATVHQPEDIRRMLAHGLSPMTDNPEALVELGFAPAYPSATKAYERSIWERAIDRGYRATAGGLRRVFVRQRAFLVT